MLRVLVPDLYLTSIHALDPEKLRRRGIRALLVDLDNTLVPWQGGRPDETLRRWVASLREAGIEPCIISNNWSERVRFFADALGIEGVAGAAKPRRPAFRKAIEKLKVTPQETAVIGDQIFTDVLGGKRLNLFTILVVPVSSRELFWTRWVRRVERMLLNRLVRQGLLRGPQGS